ncbi:MAG: glycoside hydrolase family 25, partial [Pisciglobus halotolerans]|nr:glycoside hydrolase family 25 [Pisciglobus halotolerans]
HQYTSKGKLSGYNGDLDLNQIVRRDLFYFFRQDHQTPDKENKKEVEGIEMKTITTTAKKVKLRSSPKVGNNIIVALGKGTSIKINNIVFGDGFVWGVQPRSDGKKGYIDIGKSVAWVK